MGSEKKEIDFRIYRYNPQADVKPYYDDISISVEKGITVLRALNYIKDYIEPRLTYRFFCQAGICGSCGMRINGVSKMACTTQVWDELKNSKKKDVITIEPLENFKVIKDLVIDYNPVVKKLEKYYSWVEPSKPAAELGKKEYIIQEEEFQKINAATDCILCAVCYSECSIMDVSPEFISPLVLIKAFRMNNDVRDTQSEKRLNKLAEDHGIWDCTHCYRCVEACVKKIPIMDGIHGLRNEMFKKGMSGTEGYRHAKAFMTDIKSKGRLKEATLPLRTRGIFGSLSLLPFAVRMLFKGRIPPIIIKSIPGIKHVRRIFRELKGK